MLYQPFVGTLAIRASPAALQMPMNRRWRSTSLVVLIAPPGGGNACLKLFFANEPPQPRISTSALNRAPGARMPERPAEKVLSLPSSPSPSPVAKV